MPATETPNEFFNHLELFHRPGERTLAVCFFETIGCRVDDVTEAFGAHSPYLCVHPGAEHSDPLNHVIYLSELRTGDPLEALLAQRLRSDADLRQAFEESERLRRRPGHAMHIGLRFESFEDLETVLDRVEHQLPTELSGRATVRAGFPPLTLPSLGTEVVNGFVHTDVVGTGLVPFGQLFELQAQRPAR